MCNSCIIEYNLNRRNILKSIGAAGLYSSVGVVSGTPTGNTEFTGIAYDTKTHERLGDSSANLVIKNGKLRGRIKSNGLTVPVVANKKRDLNDAQTEYSTIISKESRNNAINNSPLITKITVDEDHGVIGGYLTHANPRFGKLGFSLAAESAITNKELKEGLSPDNTPSFVKSNEANKGVPRKTGISSVAKMKERANHD